MSEKNTAKVVRTGEAASPDSTAVVPAEKPKPAPKPKPGNVQAPPRVVEIAPMARPARMRTRHWGLLFSLLLLVLAPLGVAIWYLWDVATDQYASTAGFTVRQEEDATAELLGGFASQLAGGSVGSDSNIIYEFIQSPTLIAQVNEQFDLVEHYAQPWPDDPVLSIWPDASIEDLTWFWNRVVQVSYDEASGLIELRVLAFDPDAAQTIAQAILDESQVLINELNASIRTDAMRWAEADLEEAITRLREAREAMTLFRIRTQIVDPETDLEGRLGVVNNLQGQLAQALIELDLLLEGGNAIANDPRIEQAELQIEVIRNRIAQERASVATEDATLEGQDYPTLLAEYEGLLVDREVAEESYRLALAALDLARSNASRESRYLATFVAPTLPETAEYPKRFTIIALVFGALFLIWAILALVYYSIRDSK